MDVNLGSIADLTEAELLELMRNAEKTLEDRRARRARSTLKEARRLAAEVGFEATFTKLPPAGKAAAQGPRRKAAQKYRNPEAPSETWSGRGRPPKWVQAALAEGRELSDLAIPEAEAPAS